MWLLWYFCTQPRSRIFEAMTNRWLGDQKSPELVMSSDAKISMGFAQLAGGRPKHLAYACGTFQ
jgi:hypothetical protein